MSTIETLLDGFAIKKLSEGKSRETVNRVLIDVRAFTRDTGIQNPGQITNKLTEEWGTSKRNTVSQSAVYAYYNSLRSFLHFLEEKDIAFPAERLQIRCKPDYQRMVVLRASDVSKIAQAAHSTQVDVLIRLLYCTMMRLSEALVITPDDIRHDGTIYVNGKWCKSRHVVLWPDLIEELHSLAPDGSWCFKSKLKRKDGEPLDRKTAYVFIKRAMVKAGFPQAYPHSLRHTGATEQLRHGASTEHVARQLGHTKLETTRKYLHLITDDIIHSHQQFLPKI